MRQRMKRVVSILLVFALVLTDSSFVKVANATSATVEESTTEELLDVLEAVTEEVSTQTSETDDNVDVEGETSNVSTEVTEDTEEELTTETTEVTEEEAVVDTTEAFVETTDETEEGAVASGDLTQEELLTWAQYKEQYVPDYSQLSKEEKVEKYHEYCAYRRDFLRTSEGEYIDASGQFSNDYLEVALSDIGKYTIGNVEGNPDYDTDDDEILLYGHPNPGTSETLIKIGNSEYFFEADSISWSDDSAIAVMNIEEYNIRVIQILSFCNSGNATYEDTVRISYEVVNTGSVAQSVGIRIMLDTMLADNDDAEFKVPGSGNVTTVRTYKGSAIPSSYQVYDDLNEPTTIATGYLYRGNERKPDEVHFTQWPEVNDGSWDYGQIEGEDLGDTAVAIYYYPTSIASGNSMQVATYYGVSVGSQMDGGEDVVVDSKQATVQVKDNATNTVIEGAEVKMELPDEDAKTATTDASGLVIFDDMDSMLKKATLTVSKEGYHTRTVSIDIKSGSRVSVSLKNENDTTPIVETVTLDGKDVLNGTVHYIENANDVLENSSNIKNVVLKVTADMDDVTYYLVEDEKVIARNTTGEFTLKTTTISSGTVIEHFASGGNRYVKCVSSDGKTSKKMPLGIKVSAASVEKSSVLSTNFWPYGQGSIAKGTLGALLLGDSVSFGIKDPLDLKIEVGEDGKVRVGLNFSKIPQSNEDAQEIMDTLSKGALNNTLKKKYVNNSLRISMGSVKPYVDVYGYGEGIVENGNVQVDLAIRVEGGVDASYTTNFYYVVPLYITVGAGGSIAVEVKANVHNETGWQFAVYSGTIAPSVYLSVEGGLGSKGVANLGVEGKGTLDYEYDFIDKQSKATLTGNASLVMAVWKFEKKLKLGEAAVKIYDSNDKEGTVYCSEEDNIYELLDEQPFTLRQRVNLQNSEYPEGTTNEENEFVLAGVDQYAEPVNVQVGDKTYKFWIQENTERNVVNGSMLVYSVCEDGVWSEYVAVEDDGTGDYSFDVVEDNGIIYIVWQDTNAEFEDDTVQIDDLAKAAEINMATLDTAANSISVVELTDNEIMDVEPAVTVKDGVPYVVWLSTENAVLENEKSNYIQYMTVANNVVGEVKQVDCGTKDVSQISAAVINDVPIAIYTLTPNSDTFEEPGEVYYYSMTTNEGQKVTSAEGGGVGETVTATLHGTPALFWYQNQNIWYTSDISEKQTVFSGDNNVTNEFAVADSTDAAYVVWKSGTEEGTTIYAVCHSDGQWGTPYKVKDIEGASVKNLTAVVDEDGTLVLSYVKVFYDDESEVESSTMIQEKVDARVDCVLTNVEYDEKVAAAGEVLPITLQVSNAGNDVLDAVTVQIKSDDSATYTKEITDLNLPAGESTEIVIDDFAVTTDLPDNEVVEYIVTVNADEDCDSKNNVGTCKVGYTSLVVENELSSMVDGEEYYTIRLLNNSKIPASNVRVKVLADSTEGAIVYDKSMGDLDAGKENYIYVAASDLAGSSQYYVYVTTDTPTNEVDDGYHMFSCSDETILYVSENELTVQAEEGGSVVQGESGLYYTYDEVELEAEASDGYVFNGWEITSGALKEDGTKAVFRMPDEPATVTATFIEDVETTSITLDETKLAMYVGDSAELIASTEPEINSKQIVWESDNPNVAEVSANGKVTAKKAGTAVITVTSKNNPDVTATCQVTVEDIMITSIKMVYPEMELQGVGSTEVLDVNLEPENGTEYLEWTSSNPDVVTVTEDGVITAVGAGEAIIYVESSQAKAQCQVTVNNPLLSVGFEHSTVVIRKNQETDVELAFNPVDATDISPVVWTNYSENVVEITSSGDKQQNLHIRGIGAGTALVQANVNNMVTYLTIRVEVPSTGITLGCSTVSLECGDSYYISSNITPSDTTDTITWTSSNENIVEVYNGRLYGVNPGSAVVTATTTSGFKASVQVTVVASGGDTILVTGNTFGTDNPYSGNMDLTWEVSRPGAKYIQLTFSADSELEEDYDYVYIMDQDYNIIGSYTGKELAGKIVTVNGPVARVRIKTDNSVHERGFMVTKINVAYDISAATVDTIAPQYYTGSAISPKLVVRMAGIPLTPGVHYVVSYSNNVNPGVATAVVKGVEPSTGSITVTYPIKMPSFGKVSGLKQSKTTTNSITLSWGKMEYAKGYYVYQYNSKTKKYKLVKTLTGADSTSYQFKKLKTATKYKYAVKAFCVAGNNKSEGPMTYITASTCTKTPNLKAKAGKKYVNLSWNKIKNAKGYEIYMSSKKKSGYKKKATIKKGSKVTTTIKKLKSKKTLYFKIRTYVITPNGKVYSEFSKPIKVKVK